MPGRQTEPVGCIDLPVCFGTPSNFRKETLTFEVVGFHGTYHAILGCPCYAKFMAVPNYTYLKLKIPGPKGVITIGPSYEHAYECDMECVEHEEAILESATLAVDLDGLAKEIPDHKHHAGSFEPTEDIKLMPLDPTSSDGKALKVSATLETQIGVESQRHPRNTNRNANIFMWSPSDMPGIPREVTEHALEIQAGSKLVKQRLCCFNEEKHKVIGEEIHKLLEVGFIKEVHHPEWLANPILVKKKSGKWRMCVDYTS
jgi:hypothetical protein